MIDGYILFALQRRQDVIADKGFADNLAIRMRVANPVHIGHDGKQQAIAFADGQSQRLNDSAFRRQRQTPLNFRGVGQRPRHRQRGILDAIAGCAA